MNELLNRQWAAAIVEVCIREGSRHFFLAPGSRCTPLTLAAANQTGIYIVRHFDERGLAFACQGFGRAVDHPGVFVCTSGTAVANALPAVVEASQEHVPMLLLTADRPPELRDRGANQTIDQVHLFGRYTHWFCDLPCPDGQMPVSLAVDVIRYAIAQARTGPVHINCMFREPFGGTDETSSMAVDSLAHANHTRFTSPSERFSLPAGNTLVLIGGCRFGDAIAATDLAHRLGAPALADISSSVRGLAYDIALHRDRLPSAQNVVHLGGRFVSKRLLRFLQDHPPQNFWHVWPHGTRIDPTGCVTRRIQTDIPTFCSGAIGAGNSHPDFVAVWESHAQLARQVACSIIAETIYPTEPAIAHAIADLIPSHSALFLGNSLPVRAMDSFGFWPHARDILVCTNRGASGIDGVLASAIGFAHGSGRRTTLMIGDLSLLHDLNSLAMLAHTDPNLIVVVANNDGGGIFHFLPIANQSKHFEQYFATPHGFTFQHAAEMFGIEYRRCSTMSEFREEYGSIAREDRPERSTLIEVTVKRSDTVHVYCQIEDSVRSAT
jgi:2-succinyl-5-enolpyruvyl-6-hydroxy-3-cyclohexene-1-carboxylate synthase